MSPADARAAKREFWTNPVTTRICQRIEFAFGIAGMLAVMTIGSLNF